MYWTIGIVVALSLDISLGNGEEINSCFPANHRLETALWSGWLPEPEKTEPFWLPTIFSSEQSQQDDHQQSFLFSGFEVFPKSELRKCEFKGSTQEALSEAIRWSMNYKEDWAEIYPLREFPANQPIR